MRFITILLDRRPPTADRRQEIRRTAVDGLRLSLDGRGQLIDARLLVLVTLFD
jgi:hypothetical protein